MKKEDVLFHKGIEAFNKRQFYDAHEYWEEIWLDYKLKDALLNPVEEMLVLEIALRLVYSDVKIDPKEIDFLKTIRGCLSIDDEIMTQRFGVIDFLVSSEEKIAVADENSKRKDSLDSVDMANLENMYFNVDDKKKMKEK